MRSLDLSFFEDDLNKGKTMKFLSALIFTLLISLAGCGSSEQSGGLTEASAANALTACLGDRFPFVGLDPIFEEENKARAKFEFHFKPPGKKKFVLKEGTALFEKSTDGKWYLQRVRTDNNGPQRRCKGPLPVE